MGNLKVVEIGHNNLTPAGVNASPIKCAANPKAKAVAKANKEAEAKAADQKSDAEKASNAKPKKDTRKQFTDDRGLKFCFKHGAPKSINIDGKSCKTSELIENEEVMLELVYGNSNFIEQIH